MKHTPGPWEARGYSIFEPHKTAMTIAVATQHEPNVKANARLIAAAPELLEALQAFVEWAECVKEFAGAAPIATLADARAAIAKATGETL